MKSLAREKAYFSNKDQSENNNDDKTIEDKLQFASTNSRRIKGSEISSYDEPSQSKIVINNNTTYPKYTGDLIEGKKQGKGKIIYEDGSSYEGDFRNDYYEGYGILKKKNMCYNGKFKKNLQNGKGVLEHFEEKFKYDGNWLNGKYHGYGKMIYENGQFYEGQFAKGKMDGYGNLTFENGNTYKGQFKNDKFEGTGTYTWSETKIYSGQWKENIMNGFGVFKEDTKTYVGNFIDGKKNGLGCLYNENENVFSCTKWTNNNINDGIILLYKNENEFSAVVMKNNKIVGELNSDYYEENNLEENCFDEDIKELQDFYTEKVIPELERFKKKISRV